ncbi:hypothetical protein JR316_0000994 [Psilocybe cubensis]|uniref:Transmembrane protein 135 N-terminal domain-containing protein n=2 Tax=Psilocybe cubensis TaxID=181762 RepID=A0A8H8CQV4_PSICU|nr:hypothetical protein JR316_0000994 [Psilocybe cubensis]KAH9486928.1 hypothetical protein JR316_0000994 [Psilocybe cubensis]
MSTTKKKPSTAANSTSWLDRIPSLSDDPTHPAQIALRTYALALSLSLGPSLVPFIVQALSPKKTVNGPALRRVLRRELGHDGLAFAFTLCVAGGAALKQSIQRFSKLTDLHAKDASPASTGVHAIDAAARFLIRLKRWILALSPGEQSFLSYVLSSSVGILLIQAGRERTARLQLARRAAEATASGPSIVSTLAHPALRATANRTSPTLDLTLLLIVRAIDSLVQAFILQKPIPRSVHHDTLDRQHPSNAADPKLVQEKLEKERIKRENRIRQKWTSQVDAFVFWACSARIMWCFFYEPQRLPRSYVRWINTLANLDGRIVDVLQYIRAGTWSYITGSPAHASLLQASARELGLPASWGDPVSIPAYGGPAATAAWKKMGVKSRAGVGGIPCEVLHGRVGSSLGLTGSCTANASLRMLKGFSEALAIYLPVHILPVLLTRPQILLRPHRLFESLFGAVRSATFLSSFIGLYWYTVCFTRTLVLARLFPSISHDFWDGPLGCIFAGCLACGGSIWIENGRRRGEMALYVLPRAIRAILPDAWTKSGNQSFKFAERIAFVLSISTLLTAATHRPDSLRGLSRWTLAFVTNGPSTGFWKRKRRDPSVPSTPSVAPTPSMSTNTRVDENFRADTPRI